MPRIARIVGAGYPHHIVERGNNRERVFVNPIGQAGHLKCGVQISECGMDSQNPSD